MSDQTYLVGLVQELAKLSDETPWLEFKKNNADPERLGEYISALSNGAALEGKDKAYMIWGAEDGEHALTGTTFRPATAKKGNEALENWLLRLLQPRIGFAFHTVAFEAETVVVLEIDRANRVPVTFKKTAWIRIGSQKKKLAEFPEQQRNLWRALDRTPFEIGVARDKLSADETLRLLDYAAYFKLLDRPLPAGPPQILEALCSDDLVRKEDAGTFGITRLGALLIGRRLADFGRLGRKALRVVHYRGDGRLHTLREVEFSAGYASSFEEAIAAINTLVPSNEIIGQALRQDVPMFPPLAVRELVANALIHQDLSISGTGPMVEIFDRRMEITNPGQPLVDTARFLDTPPRSRNEALASRMRRFGICEERGSGIDKVIAEIEIYQLPAPLFEVPPHSTRTVLFAPLPLSEMSSEDRSRACYLHASLRYVQRGFLTNESIRERFGLTSKQSTKASRMIREAVDAGLVVPYDPNTSYRYMKYVPWWAIDRAAT